MKRLVAVLTLALLTFGVPAACSAGDFSVVFNLDDFTLTATGTEVHVISDVEKETFGVTDDPLKDAVKAYFGKKPNQAYLHSPTPWGDLYKRYNWQQVTTVIKVKNAQVLSKMSEPVTVTSITFDNTGSSEPVTFHAKVWEQRANTEEHSWSKGGPFTLPQGIKYKTVFDRQTAASYTGALGNSHTESQMISVGRETGVDVTVPPGQTRMVKLTAKLNTLKVRVSYEVSLRGLVATNYNPTYQGHHFWELPIGEVLRAVGRPSVQEMTEDIAITFYSDPNVAVVNPGNGRELLSHPAMIKHH